MHIDIKAPPSSVAYLKKALIIFGSVVALTGCFEEAEIASSYRATQSFDNRAIAVDVDTADDSVVTTGLYVGMKSMLGILLDPNSTVTDAFAAGEGQGVFVIKHDAAGVLQWQKNIKIDEWNSVSDVKVDQLDGSIVVVGHTGPMPSTGSEQALDMFDDVIAKDADLTPLGVRPDVPYDTAKLLRSWLIVKLDSQGNEIFRRTWRECLPNTYDWNADQFLCSCEAKKVVLGDTGNIYVSGTGGSPWPMENVQIAGFDSNGNSLWDDLRTDIHVGPIKVANSPAVMDAAAEAAILNDPEQYKVLNYDTNRLFHYAWDLEVTSSNNGDVIYATIPTERADLRGMVKLNQAGDIVASRKNFQDDVVATMELVADGRVLLGGQVGDPTSDLYAAANVTLVDADLNTLSTYNYDVFDGVTFDLLIDGSSTVYGAANVAGEVSRDVASFKLTGLDTNSLSVVWHNLYNTTPTVIPEIGEILNVYSVDNGKMLTINSKGSLLLTGNAYKTEGVLIIDLPSENFVEPLIDVGITLRYYGVVPVISANFNFNINMPDGLHFNLLESNSIWFDASFDPATGEMIKVDATLGQELSAVTQRIDGSLVQVTRPWHYEDNNLRRVTVRQ